MKALIDADIFTYSIGSATDDFGAPLSWNFCAARLNAQIASIKEAVGATASQCYITGPNNFRVGVATIRPYKGKRPSTKPHHYQRVRDYMVDFHKAEIIEGIEADDELSIVQCLTNGLRERTVENGKEQRIVETIICSVDKDLNMVPGQHYNWVKDERSFVTEVDGYRAFFVQLLTGDTVDNIPGLHGVGAKSSFVSAVLKCTDNVAMYEIVHTQYKKRFGSYWQQFLEENAVLLWMLREKVEVAGTDAQARSLIRDLEAQRSALNWSKSLQASLIEML